MLKLRNEAINQKAMAEKNLLEKMRRSNKCSPKSYKHKKRALLKWVSKEKLEVKKAKINFDREQKRTMEMVNQTNQNQA